jgi:hypothetical protein
VKTPKERDNEQCYVVMSGLDSASACCVITGSPKKMVQDFLAEYVGEDIRRVRVIEARRLLSKHFEETSGAVEPGDVQLDLLGAR